jgi:ubiquinone/menaquinone biosynthesis C-methylase UbiE
MQPELSGQEVLKQRMRAMWMAGDFGKIALHSSSAAAEFVSRLPIQAGVKVLDVACGTGNLAIPAARKGASVTGLDIAPNLLEQARQRAAGENLDVTFDEGDAEQMPYGNGKFDVVMTMFGAMFAPNADRAATEMIRVCRSGGMIAMANWTASGFVAKVFAAGVRFAPPPEGVPSPLLWGDERTVKQRLANGTSAITTTVRTMKMDFPFPPREVVQFFRNYFGPIHMTFSRLDPEAQSEYAAELERLFHEHNQATDDTTLITGEYLEVIATRA